MAAALKLVRAVPKAARPKSIEAELKVLLRAEIVAIRKLASIRARIGPAKRAYLVKHKCFGMSNEAIGKELGVRA